MRKIMVLITSLILLSSCNAKNNCEHTSLTNEKFEPSLSERGYTKYTCNECGHSFNDDYTGVFGSDLERYNKELEVMFIGNSYTYFSNSWDIFKNIANGQNFNVHTIQVTSGGYTLEEMANPHNEYGKIVNLYLTKKPLDVVFMQEQSSRPMEYPELFFEAARKLNEKIVNNGAKGVMYETWGRHSSCSDLRVFNETNESMTQKLIASYNAISEELNLSISHVGTAFYKIYSEYGDEINLYHADGSHPSELGSYVVALTHYATVFGLSPIGINYKYFKNGENEQKIIEELVHEACFGESILQDQYKITSK